VAGAENRREPLIQGARARTSRSLGTRTVSCPAGLKRPLGKDPHCTLARPPGRAAYSMYADRRAVQRGVSTAPLSFGIGVSLKNRLNSRSRISWVNYWTMARSQSSAVTTAFSDSKCRSSASRRGLTQRGIRTSLGICIGPFSEGTLRCLRLSGPPICTERATRSWAPDTVGRRIRSQPPKGSRVGAGQMGSPARPIAASLVPRSLIRFWMGAAFATAALCAS
jgi:hypothetical protein